MIFSHEDCTHKSYFFNILDKYVFVKSYGGRTGQLSDLFLPVLSLLLLDAVDMATLGSKLTKLSSPMEKGDAQSGPLKRRGVAKSR